MTKIRPIKITKSVAEVCCAKTQINQIAVANIGKAMICLKVSIHAPGFGSQATILGTMESIK